MFFNKWSEKKKLSKPQKLPVGLKEFHAWSDRIISIAALPATPASQKHTLASMIMQLKPTIAFESDAFFVNSLLKAAASQVALHYAQEVYPKEKARLKELEEKQNQAEVTPPTSDDGKVLEIKAV